MRLLLVTRNFPPLVGGMETLLFNAYKLLDDRFEVALIGPAGCEEFVRPTTPATPVARSPLARFLLAAQWKTLTTASRFRPAIVLAGSGVMAPAAVFAARRVGAKVACLVHGLDLVANSLLYRKLFLPAVIGSDQLIANSRNTARLAASAGADSRRVAVLHPGVSMPSAAANGTAFRDRHGLHGRRILLSVGRLTRRKGLCEFVRYALPGIVATRPETVLLVIGDDPSDAIGTSAGQRQRILDTARDAGVGKHVSFMGRTDDGTLRAAYAAADVFVFPAIDLPGDVEGFGMVALEAAANGLPTVAFSVGGISDAVADGISGHLVSAGAYDRFAEAVLRRLEPEHREEWRARCTAHAERFGWDRYGRDLGRLLCDVAGIET